MSKQFKEKIMQTIQLKILDSRLGNEFPIPEVATPGSAGVDLRALVQDTFILKPQAAELIPTGISIYLKDSSVCAMILPRSGLGHKKGLVLGNGTGLIDSDYQGPLMISAFNRSDSEIIIEPGDRIAQLIIVPVIQPQFEIVNEFIASSRGESGFGSSGQK